MDAHDEQVAHYLKAVADALLETTRLQAELRQASPLQPARTNSSPSHRGPTNPRHQTWRGFVLDLQMLEAQARRESLRLTKTNVCQFGVDTPRTITRTMEWYGLEPTDWPPSTWDPDEPREGGKSRE